MNRNEKGQFTTSEVNYEEEIKAAEQKLADLKKAQFEKIEAEKKAAAEARKEDASKVQQAFKELNKVKLDYNQHLTQEREAYNKAVAEAKAVYLKNIAEIEKPLIVAQNNYDVALKEFQAAHPEGYHLTLKDGDNISTFTSTAGNDWVNEIFKIFWPTL